MALLNFRYHVFVYNWDANAAVIPARFENTETYFEFRFVSFFIQRLFSSKVFDRELELLE